MFYKKAAESDAPLILSGDENEELVEEVIEDIEEGKEVDKQEMQAKEIKAGAKRSGSGSSKRPGPSKAERP
jgi:hypothetical protein